MSRSSKKEMPLWARTGHRKPVTRREFLASGVIPFSAWMVGPSIGMLLSREAHAAGLCESTGPGLIPFITINLSGGPSLASQLALKTLTGSYLSSYNLIGLGAGPNVSFKIEKDFNGAEFSGLGIGGNRANQIVSQFLVGARNPNPNDTDSVARSVAALRTATLISQPVQAGDDSANNPLDISGLVLKLGMAGNKLPNLGTNASSTGIRQRPAGTPPPAPFVASNIDNLVSALGYSAAFSRMKDSQKVAVARTIASLSSAQLQRFNKVSGAESTLQLLDCVGTKNADLIEQKGGDVDPFATNSPIRTQMSNIWGVNVTARNGQALIAAMVYNALKGNSSTVNIDLGGYDYHDSTRATGDQRDLEAGQMVGKILQTANLLNSKCFIYICADGATSSAQSATADSPWVSDRGIAGMTYMIAFNPNSANPSALAPATTANQIGGFTDGQVADASFPTGGNPQLAAEAVFANYANWNGLRSFLTANRIAGDAGIQDKVIKLQTG